MQWIALFIVLYDFVHVLRFVREDGAYGSAAVSQHSQFKEG